MLVFWTDVAMSDRCGSARGALPSSLAHSLTGPVKKGQLVTRILKRDALHEEICKGQE